MLIDTFNAQILIEKHTHTHSFHSGKQIGLSRIQFSEESNCKLKSLLLVVRCSGGIMQGMDRVQMILNNYKV